jgi:formylglycine-generating enzyme required for sulfatase activity
LSDREGRKHRLPTEAEWEYACRAGTNTAFASGDRADTLKKLAWFDSRQSFLGLPSRDAAHVGTRMVAQGEPNGWGIFDMHGNVREWTADSYGTFATDAVTDPHIDQQDEDRVHRGGAWNEKAASCRCAFRDADNPARGLTYVGFRVLLEE